jgi:hypothetical protein
MTPSMAGSRTIIGRLSSVTAARTAAISSASGGSGMNSLAPALIAAAARIGSASTPQATTGTRIRSDSLVAIRPAMSSVYSTISRSAPCPARSAWVAASQVSTCETLAPVFIAIFTATESCPFSFPTTRRRIVFSPLGPYGPGSSTV